MQRKQKRGFTLIEVIVVLAITAIVGGIAVPLAYNSNNAVNARACQSSRDSLFTYFMMYRKLNGGTEDLNAFLENHLKNTHKGDE
ncbi:MAG: type II secretion system protein, partial [Ruthenibacterium sp.]